MFWRVFEKENWEEQGLEFSHTLPDEMFISNSRLSIFELRNTTNKSMS